MIIKHTDEIMLMKNISPYEMCAVHFPNKLVHFKMMNLVNSILAHLPHFQIYLDPGEIVILPPGYTYAMTNHKYRNTWMEFKIEINKNYNLTKYEYWNVMVSQDHLINLFKDDKKEKDKFESDFQNIFYHFIKNAKNGKVDDEINNFLSLYIKSTQLMIELDNI